MTDGPLPTTRRTLLLWALLLAATVSALLPDSAPPVLAFVLAEMQVAFALVHLATWTRWRTALLALVVVAGLSYASEWLGVHTGITFGHYRYSETVLGPLVSGVPPLIMLAYFSIGYASYVLARIIVCGGRSAMTARITGGRLVLTAVIAGLLATLDDLAFDPISSTLDGQWTWAEPGPYFGVAAHNFYGWWGTVAVCTTALGLLLARTADAERMALPRTASFAWQPVVLYGIFALPLVLGPLLGKEGPIYASMSIVASLAMSLPLLVAAALLTRPGQDGPADVPAPASQ